MPTPTYDADDMGPLSINASSDGSSRLGMWLWLCCGIALVALMLATQAVDRPASAGDPPPPAIRLGPWPLIPAGVVCLLAAWIGPRRLSWRVLAVMLLVAIGMRAPMWRSPIWPGADCQRYLWDGAMVANGVDPYRHTPQAVMAGTVDDPTVQRLAIEGAATLEQITSGDLRTIYPPVAQGMFAVAYRIEPFSMTAWRIVLTGADVLAAIMVVLIGRARKLPAACAVLYLWNPVLVWEIHMAGHVDVAAAALAMVGVWLLLRQRWIGSATAFVLAAGVKLWPLVLLVFVFAPLWGRWRRMAAVAIVTICLVAVLAALFATSVGADSGLGAYSRHWAANDGAFRLAHVASRVLPADPDVTARAILAIVLAGATVVLARGASGSKSLVCERIALTVMLMLLLSPTLYPWYYVAVIPLAAVAPLSVVGVWTIAVTVCYWQVGSLNGPARWALVHLPAWVLWIGAFRRRNATCDLDKEP